MCNPKPSSPTSPFLSPTKTHLINPHTKSVYSNPTLDDDLVQDELQRWPTLKEALTEIKEIGKISGPTTITGLLLYSRAMISMIFLGYLGEMELAGGSLSIGFANITGYSVISGLAMGMEPICGQAYGAKQWKILGLTLQRTVLLLLSTSIPISFIWFNMKRILLFSGVSIAMVLTNLNLVILLSSFLYFSRVYKDSWISPSLECIKGWSSLLSLAIPTCVSVCLEWWWYEFMIMMCGLLVNPKATIASMGILIQTTSLVYVFPSSLSLGVSTRIGNELGLGAMLFTTLMRNQWGKFFTNDKEILELTSIVLPIVGLCELGNCPQTTGCGVLRGSARPTIGANINLGSFYLVGMPVAIFLGFVAKFGFAGLWIGLLAAQGSCAMLMLVVLCRTDWNLQVQRAKELTKDSTITTTCDDDVDAKLPTFMEGNNNMNKNKVHGCLEEIVITHDEKDPLIITTTTTKSNYIED
ncbi:multidrug and toxin extrusion protein 1-like [Trifolium pratense]|uniref:Protein DETOXIFICATION n=1 Tax=Trifolium pratense TaxID=57577 RepID=A0A2K3NN62_TRIPR|nr:multidrug and toxin extrusion protein 1-like [Trifolium pratense]